jgi:MFS family permease
MNNVVQYWVSILLTTYGAALFVFSRKHHPRALLLEFVISHVSLVLTYLALWGFFADRIPNRKIPMVAGLALLGGATALLCAGTKIPMLVIGRLLQGASAALVWTVGLALIFDTIQGQNVGRAMGWVSTSISAALLSSPMLGGIVYQYGGYYSVYAMCFGLIAVDILMRLSIVEVKYAKQWDEHNDLPLDGITVTPTASETSGPHISASNSITSPPAEETNDQMPTQQSKPSQSGILSLLRKPRLLAALWGNLVLGIIDTSFNSTLPLFVVDAFGWNSTGAGLIFLPLQVPSLLGPLVGIGSDRWGAKPLVAGGFLLAIPFLICLRFVADNTLAHKAILCVLLGGIGIARAMVVGPLMAEITMVINERTSDEKGLSSSGKSTIAQAYGLYNMAFSGGSILGPIMAGMIRDASGWGTVGWSLAVLAAFTFVTQAIWIGGPLRRM